MNATKEDTTSVQFPIWKTIKIGGSSRQALQNSLKEHGLRKPNSKRSLCSSHFGYYLDLKERDSDKLTEERQINLTRIKVKELGFTSRPTVGQLFDRIEEVGEFGSLEFFYHLRWYFPDDLMESRPSDEPNEWIIGSRSDDTCYYSQKSGWLAIHGSSQDVYMPKLDDWIIFIVT